MRGLGDAKHSIEFMPHELNSIGVDVSENSFVGPEVN